MPSLLHRNRRRADAGERGERLETEHGGRLELAPAALLNFRVTDAELFLSPRLLPADTALPTDSQVDVSGIFVQPPDDALPLLMPRSSEDWASAD